MHDSHTLMHAFTPGAVQVLECGRKPKNPERTLREPTWTCGDHEQKLTTDSNISYKVQIQRVVPVINTNTVMTHAVTSAPRPTLVKSSPAPEPIRLPITEPPSHELTKCKHFELPVRTQECRRTQEETQTFQTSQE